MPGDGWSAEECKGCEQEPVVPSWLSFYLVTSGVFLLEGVQTWLGHRFTGPPGPPLSTSTRKSWDRVATTKFVLQSSLGLLGPRALMISRYPWLHCLLGRANTTGLQRVPKTRTKLPLITWPLH